MATINKIIRLLYYFLFLLAPLVMASFTSELFEFNKIILIYALTLLILFFWALKMILLKKIIIKKTFFDIPIVLFLVFQFISTMLSIDPHTSFFGYYGRFNGGLLSTIAYLVLYYAFVSNLTVDKKVVANLLKVSLISSFLVILWGLPGKFGHDLSCLIFLGQFNNSCWTDQFRPAERMFSTLGQPNWLGAYLAVHFFIGFYFLASQFKKFALKISAKKLLLVGYLIFNLIAIVFTNSRSALLAVGFGIGAIAYVLFYRFLKKRNKVLSNILIVSVIFFIVTTGYFIFRSELTNKTANSTSGISESGDIRKIVWRGAIDLGMRYPLFGTGVETFAYSYYFTRPVAHNLTSEWDFLYNKAHNEYLNFFATTGFAGLISYLVLILCFFVYFWSQFRPVADKDNDLHKLLVVSLTLSYITILITNFFGFSTTTINLFFYLIPGLLIVSGTKAELSAGDSKQKKADGKMWLMLGGLIIVGTFLFINLIRYYLADINYAKGDSYAKQNDYQKAAQYLTEAYNLKPDHVYEDRLSYVLANVAFVASYQKDTQLAKKMIEASDSLSLKSLQESPKNVLYWKTRAKDYYLIYQITLNKKDLEIGISSLKIAAKLAPTDPKIPYSLAIFYSLLADETKNKDVIAQLEADSLSQAALVVSLKPDYRDGYFLQGQLLKKAGKKDEAKIAFEYILLHLDPKDAEAQKELDAF